MINPVLIWTAFCEQEPLHLVLHDSQPIPFPLCMFLVTFTDIIRVARDILNKNTNSSLWFKQLL